MFRRLLKRQLIILLVCNAIAIGLMLNPALGIQLVRAACGPSNCWSIIPSPSQNPTDNYLFGVAFISSNVGLAVGNYDTNNGFRTLIERWDGTQWSIISSPNPGTNQDQLNGVTVVPSAGYAWAVGYYKNTGGVQQALIEVSTDYGQSWSQVTTPSGPGSGLNELTGISAVATNDVWAVGYYYNAGGRYQTLIEHWNGTSWSIVSSPDVSGAHNYLKGVSAVSASDVWAVGYYSFIGDSVTHTRILHWNGSTWSSVASPDAGLATNNLNGVAGISATDATWAVGNYSNTGQSPPKTLTEHWNGTSWSIVSSPNPSTTNANILFSVAPVASNYVWAVPYYDKPPYVTMTLRCNGTNWTLVHSPDQGTKSNILTGVAVRPGTAIGQLAGKSTGRWVAITITHIGKR